MQMLLVNNGLDPIESIYYIFPATGISQLLMIILYERSALTEPASWVLVMRYWYLFFLAIALGIAVNLVGIFVIKHTSGLMLKLIGVVRNNFIVLLSVLFLGEKTTSIQIFGYILSIAGFVWYANLTHTAKHVDESVTYKELDDL
jgi:drug/metabolite transporter (DMT)-like permease